LQKGLMAGMGAYGGASLAGGLMGSAASTIPEAAQLAAGAGDSTAGIGAMSGADKMAAGVQGLGTEAGRSAFMQNVGGGSGLLKSGLAAAAPAMFATPRQPQGNPSDANMGQRYKYSPGLVNPTPAADPSGREQRYYNPSYTKISDAEAKSLYGYAGGGDIQTDDAAPAKADPLAFFHERQAQAAAQPAPKKIDVAGDYANYLSSMKSKNPNPVADAIAARPTGEPKYEDLKLDYDPKSPDFTREQALANLKKTMENVGANAAIANKYYPAQERMVLAPKGGGYAYDQARQQFVGSTPTTPTTQAADQVNNNSSESAGYAGGGPVEAMSNANAIGANTGFPQADILGHAYATPYQTPISQNVVQGTADTGVNSMTGEQNEFARGGLSSAAAHLGDYSDGGRLLKGPGDGVSDSIPAVIGNKRPARLADGEFVVPARIVSELGNGSTEAGARKLYAMLDRVQAARKQSIGKGKVAKNSRADKLLPA
jgi:hypothetical protein